MKAEAAPPVEVVTAPPYWHCGRPTRQRAADVEHNLVEKEQRAPPAGGRGSVDPMGAEAGWWVQEGARLEPMEKLWEHG